MKQTRAAVLYEPKTPLRLERVTMPEPSPGAVLVRLRASGVCHTDLHVWHGHMDSAFPIILGHEGAGVVAAVGDRVTHFKRGDCVVISVIAPCGRCDRCQQGQSHLCEHEPVISAHPQTMDGTTLHRMFGIGSFAEYALVPQERLVKLPADVPLEIACLLGCGASTGIGAVLNTAKVTWGSTVAIFGCGGVGLSAVMAAKLTGAQRIIGVDILSHKLRLAKQLGATDTINAQRDDPVERIRSLTDGGCDFAFECVGSIKTMEQAWQSIRAGGKCVVIGAAPSGEHLTIDPHELLSEKTLTGSLGGSIRPHADISHFLDFYRQGRLPLDKLISATYSLSQVNEALQDLEAGRVVKAVVRM